MAGKKIPKDKKRLRRRIDILLDPGTIIRLEQLVKNAENNGSKLASKSRIIEELIMKCDPLDHAKEQAKHHQRMLMMWKDKIDSMEEHLKSKKK